MAETVVGEAQGIRKHPAFAVILGEERFDAPFPVAASRVDLRFQVVKGDERQDGVTELGVLVSVNSPESSRIQRGGMARARTYVACRQV